MPVKTYDTCISIMQKKSIVHNQNKNQSGFGVILILLILAAIGTVAAGAVIKVNEAKSKQASEVAQNNANQRAAVAKATAVKKKLEKKSEPSPSPSASASPAPSSSPAVKPVVTVKPTIVPTAKPITSYATPFTMANCNGNSTVYVSNKNGAQASYNSPGQWSAYKTYPYGSAISVYCQVDGNASGPASAYAPDYVIANDAFIKASDLSPTKP